MSYIPEKKKEPKGSFFHSPCRTCRLLYVTCYVFRSEWSTINCETYIQKRLHHKGAASSTGRKIKQSNHSCSVLFQATFQRLIFCIYSQQKSTSRKYCHFSGSKPRGLNLKTSSKINPMVSKRIWATLSKRCSFNGLLSSNPIVATVINN